MPPFVACLGGGGPDELEGAAQSLKGRPLLLLLAPALFGHRIQRARTDAVSKRRSVASLHERHDHARVVDRDSLGVVLPRPLTREDLPQHDGEGVDLRLDAVLVGPLLGRHVGVPVARSSMVMWGGSVRGMRPHMGPCRRTFQRAHVAAQ